MEKLKLTPQERAVDLKQSDDFYLGLTDIEFRNVVQGRIHHSLEIQVLHCLNTGARMTPRRVAIAEYLLELWDRRGMSHELSEYRFAKKYLELAYEYLDGVKNDLSAYAPKRLSAEEQKRFDKMLYGRRTTRSFLDKDVPDELIDELIDAGLWAPNGGNMQLQRFLVIHEKNAPGLFPSSDIPGAPVHIVVAVCNEGIRALRCEASSDPVEARKRITEESMTTHRNFPLNCAAAGQNIIMAAHACGLACAWQTFGAGEADALHQHFNLPENIHLVTYIDVGYAAFTPPAPPRMDVKKAIIGRI